ncbi:MAG: cation-transporting P-type ATPase, partial [Betaproteobacteria bacterium]|nr:cation-transporting P-type ATPase [Betaproteobacteria bacterium]
MTERADGNWHARPAREALEALGSSPRGLPDKEARRRLEQYGRNALPEPARRHPLLRFLAQFHNPLIYFLLAAAIAAGILGHAVDAAVIAAVVLINAAIGFIQEGKAEAALEAMRKMVSPRASVLRDGARRT